MTDSNPDGQDLSTGRRTDTTKHANTMQESPRQGEDGTTLAGSVPSSPTESTTVSVSTDYAERFLTAEETRRVRQDPVLTLKDVFQYGGGDA